MNDVDVMEVAREAVIVMLKVSSPLLILALLVGLTISLFQALTQMQEMTLTFVPKALVISCGCRSDAAARTSDFSGDRDHEIGCEAGLAPSRG